jgi:hypothetical protein
VFVLEALLGLSEADALLEYELSSMYAEIINRNFLKENIKAFYVYPGNTIREKAENYLLSIGVTEEEIETIRAIFLEDIPTG